MISILYKDVQTDISLTDALKYANYIEKIDMNAMTMQTLPGSGQYVGDVSYFIHDPEATEALVDQIFYSEKTPVSDSAGTTGSVTASDSKNYTIQVRNGGNVTGLANRYTETLKAEGYQLTTPDNYTGTQNNYTRILVSEDGMGEDLISYFSDARVEVAPSELPTGVDICIILGTNES